MSKTYTHEQLVAALREQVTDINEPAPEDLEEDAEMIRATVYATVEHLGRELKIENIEGFMRDCAVPEEAIDLWKSNGGNQ